MDKYLTINEDKYRDLLFVVAKPIEWFKRNPDRYEIDPNPCQLTVMLIAWNEIKYWATPTFKADFEKFYNNRMQLLKSRYDDKSVAYAICESLHDDKIRDAIVGTPTANLLATMAGLSFYVQQKRFSGEFDYVHTNALDFMAMQTDYEKAKAMGTDFEPYYSRMINEIADLGIRLDWLVSKVTATTASLYNPALTKLAAFKEAFRRNVLGQVIVLDQVRNDYFNVINQPDRCVSTGTADGLATGNIASALIEAGIAADGRVPSGVNYKGEYEMQVMSVKPGDCQKAQRMLDAFVDIPKKR